MIGRFRIDWRRGQCYTCGMNDYATKADVQTIVNKAVDDLSGVIASLAQSMHDELITVKTDLREGINQLADTVDGIAVRMDRYEIGQASRDQ